MEQTTVGRAIRISTSDGKPLGAVDSFRVARLLHGDGSGVVRIHPRALRGAEVLLRRGTSDASVAFQTFVQGLHVPPLELESPHVVWDLGSNIGLTVAHYACLYPGARVVGVEPDPENATLARRNIHWWHERCALVECAVWSEDGDIAFELVPGREFGARIVDAAARHVRACSLTTLLADEVTVDLLKVDIEGAERVVLKHNTEWAEKVRNIIVEVHAPYTPEKCMGDLKGLGFTTSINPNFWVSVVGTKRV
jgi:FkbM family methyltransferase